jgi:hypothetical protein
VVARILFTFALIAGVMAAQAGLTVAQLMQFIESSIRLKHPDRQVASYVERLKMKERLDDRTVEEMEGMGAGPKTVSALKTLAAQSKAMPAPVPKQAAPPPPTIPPPSAEDQKRVITEAREYAMNYSKSLPDFICTQVTRRYYDPSGLEFWNLQDTLTTRLTYFEQKENYKLILVNNQVTEMPYEALGGASSTGEFGSILREVFDPDSRADYQWERWTTLRGKRSHVYSYRIRQVNSKWRLSFERRDEIIVGYSGQIFIERDSGAILRITLIAEDIPPAFPIRQAGTVLDYDYTKIGEQDFLLPLRAVVRMRNEKLLTKNEVEFRLYRKFGADVAITFETPEPLPEDQTKEQPVQPEKK